MADPSSYVNFADYMGLNDEAGQDMLNRALEPGEAMRREAMADIEAQDLASNGGTASFEGTGGRKGLASYGEFMKGLNDPAARQQLLEKVYGRGSVSQFDEALMGSGSGNAQRIEDARAAGVETERYAKVRRERGAQRAGMADQSREQDAAYGAQMDEKRAAHSKMLAKRAEDDENARIDDWARNSGDFGGQGFDGRNYDPNAMVSGGSSSGWDLMKNPLGQAMNPNISAREQARGNLGGWESGQKSYAARKWVKGSTAGGGGYNDSAILAEQKRRWQNGGK